MKHRTAVELLVAQVEFDRGVDIELPKPHFRPAYRRAVDTQAPIEIKRRVRLAVELFEADVGFACQTVFLRRERDIDGIRLDVDLWPIRLVVLRGLLLCPTRLLRTHWYNEYRYREQGGDQQRK